MRAKALEGLALDDVFIFDVHGHADGDPRLPMLDADNLGLISSMDRTGINGCCLSSIAAMTSNPKLGNDYVAKLAKEHPGRLYGYVVPTPYDLDYDVESYFTPSSGMLGFKIHASYQKTFISDPRYYPAYELANKLKLPVLIHSWQGTEVNQVAEMAAKFKDANFIIAHSAVLPYRDSCISVCRKYDNLYVDTAISHTTEDAIPWVVNNLGADKVLFGTDMCFFDCRQNVGKVALANISDADKIKIFGENAKQLFKL